MTWVGAIGLLACCWFAMPVLAEAEPPRDGGDPEGLPPLRIFDWDDEDGPPPNERRRKGREGRRRGMQRHRGMHDGPPGHPPGGPPMTREEMHELRERTIKFVKEHFPERHAEMLELRERDRREFRRRIMEVIPKIREMMILMDRNPELGALVVEERQIEFQIEKAARQYGETDNATSRDALRREIRQMAEDMHEVRAEIAEHKIAQLEKRLEQVRSRLEKDRDRKQQRINRFLEDLGVSEE